MLVRFYKRLNIIILLALICLVLFCGCGEANSNKETTPKIPLAVSLELDDKTVFVGQSVLIEPKVETDFGTYDQGFVLKSSDKKVFEVIDGFVVAKKAGVAFLSCKVVSGIDKNTSKKSYLEKTATIVVQEKSSEQDEPKIFVGTTTKNPYSENFEDITKDDLITLEKDDENFVLYALNGTESDKMEGNLKKFFFYGVILFDNIDFDWYNFTITCNSNVLHVEKIDATKFLVFAKSVGEGFVSLKDETKNFEKTLIFSVQNCPAKSVEFFSEQNFELFVGQSIDMAPKVQPAYATANVTLFVSQQTNVLKVSNTTLTALETGTATVTVSVDDFSKTFAVSVLKNGISIFVPQTNFVANAGQTVEIKFLISGTSSDYTNIEVLGDLTGLEFDTITDSVIVFCENKKTFSLCLALKNKSGQILATSKNIVIVFT